MSAGRRGITDGASVLLLSVAPVMVHCLMRNSAPGWPIYGVAAMQIAAIGWVLSGRWAIRYRAALVAGSFAVAFMLLDVLPDRIAGLAAAGGCHAVAYTSLLVWFAASLRPGQEPLVTGFARRVRQTMPEKVVHYTRQVTIAWCVFFAAQLAISAALLLLAPTDVWSAFLNLLNLPLLAAMALGEFGVRTIVFRHEPHTSLAGTMSAWRRVRAAPAGPN